MEGAEQLGGSSCRAGRETGEASGQAVGRCLAGMPPVVIADGREYQGDEWVYRIFTIGRVQPLVRKALGDFLRANERSQPQCRPGDWKRDSGWGWGWGVGGH